MTKSTNYYNTFIEVAEDCPVKVAAVPIRKVGKPTAASIQFEMLSGNPYTYTSDDVLFQVFAVKNGIACKDTPKAREQFFSKGQPCLRASPLTKRYGWGVHCDTEGRVAIFAVESKEYASLAKNKDLRHLKAMRSTQG